MTTTQQRPGVGTEALHMSFAGDTHSLRDNGPVRLAPAVENHLSRYAVRMLEDAITEAMPWHWTRRAQDFENARPRRGEFHGRATSAELSERDQRLAEQAEACRLHARFLREYPTPLTEFERSVVVAIIGGGE